MNRRAGNEGWTAKKTTRNTAATMKFSRPARRKKEDGGEMGLNYCHSRCCLTICCHMQTRPRMSANR